MGAAANPVLHSESVRRLVLGVKVHELGQALGKGSRLDQVAKGSAPGGNGIILQHARRWLHQLQLTRRRGVKIGRREPHWRRTTAAEGTSAS